MGLKADPVSADKMYTPHSLVSNQQWVIGVRAQNFFFFLNERKELVQLT